MDQSKEFNPCAVCASHCKTVFGFLLIVMGLRLLARQFTESKKNKQEAG